MFPDSLLFLSHVLGFDGNTQRAILSINRNDLNFKIVAYLDGVSSIFTPIDTDFSSFQHCFNFFSHLQDSLLGVNLFNLTVDNRTTLIDSNIVIERIFFHLL